MASNLTMRKLKECLDAVMVVVMMMMVLVLVV
jgi:hypothetical protein